MLGSSLIVVKDFTMDNVTGIFLRKEVSELRKRGESWGLTKEEIDEAILRALGERPAAHSKDKNKTKHKPYGHFSFCLKLTAWIIFLPFVLYVAVAVVSSAHPKFALYIGQATADFQYPFQRFVRFMSLPLHRFFDMSKYGSWECIIDNPLFVQEERDCSLCQTVRKISSHSSANLSKSAFKKRFYDTGLPVIVKDMPGYTGHSFEKFMELFHANQVDLEQDACEFYSNGDLDESVQNLTSFLTSWDHYKAEGNTLSWKICYGKGLRMLRAMFPRPYCIHSEGSLDKNIHLLQPAREVGNVKTQSEQVLEAARGSFDNVWLAQVTGSSSFSLVPVDECESECESFEFTLNKGEVVFLSQHTWMAKFYNPGSEPGMVFSAAFA